MTKTEILAYCHLDSRALLLLKLTGSHMVLFILVSLYISLLLTRTPVTALKAHPFQYDLILTNDIYKDRIFRYDHILRYCGSALEHIFLGSQFNAEQDLYILREV